MNKKHMLSPPWLLVPLQPQLTFFLHAPYTMQQLTVGLGAPARLTVETQVKMPKKNVSSHIDPIIEFISA